MRFALITTLLFWSCSANLPVQPSASTPAVGKTEIVNLCGVIEAPQTYVGKTLKVRAAVRKGFESFDMYSVKCSKTPNTTVPLDYSEELRERESVACEGSTPIEPLSHPLMGAKTFGVVAVGKFEARPDPPYVNPFRYAFVISCFESVITLDDRGYIPASLTPEDRAKIDKFESN